MKVKVIVMPKAAVLDPQGNAVRDAMRHLGMPEVRSVRIGKYMEIDVDGQNGDLEARLHGLCRDLLSNPVIEDYELQKAGSGKQEKTEVKEVRALNESAAIFFLRGAAAPCGAHDRPHCEFLAQYPFDFARLDSRSHSRVPGRERLSR